MAGPRNGRVNMIEDLNELQRRMLSRQQQHYSQCAVLNGISLVVIVLVVGFVSVFVWKETSPPEFRTDAEYAASYIGSDRKSPAQGEPSEDAPASP